MPMFLFRKTQAATYKVFNLEKYCFIGSSTGGENPPPYVKGYCT